MRFAFQIFSYVLWFVCTLLLLLPNPKLLFFQVDVPEEPARGYEHLIMFAVLTICVLLAHAKRHIRVWAFVLIAYGFATEILQMPIPYRTFEWIDVLEDTLGVLLGLGTVVLLIGNDSDDNR